MRFGGHALLAFALSACAATSTPAPGPGTQPSRSPPAERPSLAAPSFVEDDYPAALAQARATNRPLFVDAWAPWCHTCLSMRAYVFPDEALWPLAKDFVWLSLDTEKVANAKFLDEFAMQVWPTLWVIDPKDEKPALKWLGSATAKELAGLLDDARDAVARGDAEGGAGAALLRGHRDSAAGKGAEAVREYRAALVAAPPHWKKRAQAVEALVARLDELKLDAECVETSMQEMAKLPAGTSLANVGLSGLECARRSPEGSPARANAAVLARAVEQIALDESVPILADDRSGLFEAAALARREDKDVAGARALAARWADFLERQARAAKTPEGRAVFDAHRLLAYLAVGDPARALPMLASSERDFPRDYNPPARIAKVDLELQRYEDGLAAIERALSRGYGPRKVRLYLLEAQLLEGRGDKPGAATALREAQVYAAQLPFADKPTQALAEVEVRLAGMASTAVRPPARTAP
jgi:tetratricopeptide (TPR) repeat protein